jgi:hypothetical protein
MANQFLKITVRKRLFLFMRLKIQGSQPKLVPNSINLPEISTCPAKNPRRTATRPKTKSTLTNRFSQLDLSQIRNSNNLIHPAVHDLTLGKGDSGGL